MHAVCSCLQKNLDLLPPFVHLDFGIDKGFKSKWKETSVIKKKHEILSSKPANRKTEKLERH